MPKRGQSFIEPSLYEGIISSPELVYILGLLWADGYIIHNPETYRYVVRLKMVRKDLFPLRHLFDKTGIWMSHEVKHEGMYGHIFSLSCYDKLFSKFLSEHGYCGKHSASQILSLICPTLHYLWWRGYSDGDGCFSLQNKSAAFTYSGPIDETWDEASQIMTKQQVDWHIVRRINKYGKASIIKTSKFDSVIRWGDYLYHDYSISPIGLARKYEVYIRIKNLPRNPCPRRDILHIYPSKNRWKYMFRYKGRLFHKGSFLSHEEACIACDSCKREIGYKPKERVRFQIGN